MSVPGIWLHCANNSLATPQNRFRNPYLVRHGWRAFLTPTLDIVRRFQVPAVFIAQPFGEECRTWANGDCPTREELATHATLLRRQSFHMYRDSVARGVDPGIEELHECVWEMRERGCNVIMYVGPWLHGALTTENLRSELEWAFGDRGCIVSHMCDDGSGSRVSPMVDCMMANGIEQVMEPMAQRLANDGTPISPAATTFESLTIESSLRDMSGFFPLSEYTGTRYWVDNVNLGYGDAFWTLARRRIGEGFVPCIEPNADAFSVWEEMIVANPS